jgi:hypothetical protein
MGKSSSPPASPDYTGAAVAQGQQNLQLAQYALGANRTNQQTPYGNLTWSYNPPPQGAYGLQGTGTDPLGGSAQPAPGAVAPAPSPSPSVPDPNATGPSAASAGMAPFQPPAQSATGTGSAAPGWQNPGGWTSTITLSPAQQQLLNQQQALQAQQGQLAQGQLGAFAQRQAPTEQNAQDIYNKAYSAQTERLDPQWQQAEQQQAAQLQAQGITPGMAAYDNAMRSFNQAKNDAYQQAQLAAIQTMPQTYGMDVAAYNLPLNTYSSLMSGAAPTNPSLAASGMMGTPQGGNLLGAAQAAGQYGANLFSAQQAQQGAMNTGLMNLAGALGYGALTNPNLFTGAAAPVGAAATGVGASPY